MITALAALTLPFSATAAGAAVDPIESPELTANDLYKTGPLPRTKCAEKRVRSGDKKQARAYINGIIACLDRTWGAHLSRAGLAFDKVRVKHVNRVPKKYCDFDYSKNPSQMLYCDSTQTIMVQLGKDWLEGPDDLWLFHHTAAMYGYHVQNVVGIADAHEDEPYDRRSELLEQARRSSLQADCLSGAFLKSVWPLKGRSSRDFRELLSLIEGDARGEERWYGKTANMRAWIKRGFASGDPRSCNTWAASSSRVA
ncbi:neutral zinc metallopeptidase [Nonomuraea sp. MCN248]|uniref:Neutral zinc metallopeptidase n=1 Tax=Nonomuraea corallina TaxID=2989783 RepID=A0ABT4SHY3_9ACTN|nr:neutral zinc metallopeptidase [Nonomuraea corallina]MDA0636827.1 neutral zinc metallopeptidase [Nonomuraea corallina]